MTQQPDHLHTKGLVIIEWSPEKIALMKQVHKHPLLMGYIKDMHPDKDWGEMLGEIAAYCLVGMDGDYYPFELNKLYSELVLKLIWIAQHRSMH